jgi:hypothetical protein
MTASKIIPPVFLVQREPVCDVLSHQVWAQQQLNQLLGEADRCVSLTARKKMTPAGARHRLAKIARSMHEAILEFSKVVKTSLKPANRLRPELSAPRVPVPHGHAASLPENNWRQWQWQATNPAAGCLALEAGDWNDQTRAADLWIQRALHRALTLRAAGEYLAVRLDGLTGATKIMKDLQKQLAYADDEFWSRFTLAASVGFRRPQAS